MLVSPSWPRLMGANSRQSGAFLSLVIRSDSSTIVCRRGSYACSCLLGTPTCERDTPIHERDARHVRHRSQTRANLLNRFRIMWAWRDRRGYVCSHLMQHLFPHTLVALASFLAGMWTCTGSDGRERRRYMRIREGAARQFGRHARLICKGFFKHIKDVWMPFRTCHSSLHQYDVGCANRFGESWSCRASEELVGRCHSRELIQRPPERR